MMHFFIRGFTRFEIVYRGGKGLGDHLLKKELLHLSIGGSGWVHKRPPLYLIRSALSSSSSSSYSSSFRTVEREEEEEEEEEE